MKWNKSQQMYSAIQGNFRKVHSTAETDWIINIWAIYVIEYLRNFLNLTREELRNLNQTTKKLITVQKGLHSRNDVYKLHMKRNDRERRLVNICVKSASKRLQNYARRCNEKLSITVKSCSKMAWLQNSKTKTQKCVK